MISSPHLKIGIVCSQFNHHICQALEEKTREGLSAAGITQIQSVYVPGALEIPLALQTMAESKQFDALIALGAIIRGETYHFELVANESARGITQVSLSHKIPIANAILTTENERQANERLHKGWESVLVVVHMVHTLRSITI
jgi:6,7-dimethyl-8-ribityllumazine synthase